MDIEKLSISLPAQQVAWIEQRIRAGGYANRSEYIRELIRADQKRLELEALRDKLLASQLALDHGQGIEATDEWFDGLLKKLETMLHARTPRESGGRGAA